LQDATSYLELPTWSLNSPPGSLFSSLLSGRGAVWVQGPPLPDYQAWLKQYQRFSNSPGLANKDIVKFSVNTENLARTVDKSNVQAEKRTIFDVKPMVLESSNQNYSFFQKEYEATYKMLVPRVLDEIASVAPDIELCRSKMGESILRHNVYPAKGSAGEHTDYGILTVSHFDSPGLELKLDGQWYKVTSKPGCYLAIAGDMTARITSGIVPAVLHRVLSLDSSTDEVVRQSHVFFIQPSKDDLVEASITFRERNKIAPFQHFEPLRYGDWHDHKSRLAFQQTQSST
jgi:isopenicillin N synthase-like dioxygenase